MNVVNVLLSKCWQIADQKCSVSFIEYYSFGECLLYFELLHNMYATNI